MFRASMPAADAACFDRAAIPGGFRCGIAARIATGAHIRSGSAGTKIHNISRQNVSLSPEGYPFLLEFAFAPAYSHFGCVEDTPPPGIPPKARVYE